MDQKELREQENRCIQEQAPACSATCPLHVDVKGMAAAMAKGDFALANKLYRKTVPFPEIISRICDQPCKNACLRSTLGGAIEMAALERAALEYGSQSTESVKALPRKPKTVAIIGGGICGLTAAYDLARKGWGVVLFEAGDRLGGGLLKTPPDLLPPHILQRELSIIESLGVEVRYHSVIGRLGGNGNNTFIDRLAQDFDAIFLATGAHSSDLTDLQRDASGMIVFDPVTYQTSNEKVFVGGDILRTSVYSANSELHHSAVLSISEGRRAAISIDRTLQKVSLTASRVNEGSYQTKLYTNTSEIKTEQPIEMTNQTTLYAREVAETEAARCIQCECLECVKHCEYLRHYKGYPKKYIREAYNNLAIVMGTRHSNQFINTCALCGLCAEICPTDVNMGDICHDARETMVQQKRMPPSAHDFALRDMAFSNSEKFALSRTAPGADSTQKAQYAFFPGCQLSGSSPSHVQKAYADLREKLPNVGIMLRCCGAPADWAARDEIFEKSKAEFYAEYEALGKPTLILACSSCHQTFRKHYPDVELLSLWECYDRFGFEIPPENMINRRITVHDPCSTRYEKGIQDSVRNILQKAGCEVEELLNSRERTECCSFGGAMWLANKPVAEKMVQRRINESPLDYMTYCAMCRDFFAQRGKGTVHLLDILYGNPNPNAPAVGFSQKHENRARLKANLLKTLWSEQMAEKDSYESIRLVLPMEVQQIVEDRLVLVEDMQKVLEYAETSHKRMFNSKTGHYLASFKPNAVTYWVEYTPQNDGSYLIHKAYSHRMELGIGG